MSIKADIKKAFRDLLSRKPGKLVSISLRTDNVVSVEFGHPNYAYKLRFPEYDDEGDVATKVWWDDIFASIETIANEHNDGI